MKICDIKLPSSMVALACCLLLGLSGCKTQVAQKQGLSEEQSTGMSDIEEMEEEKRLNTQKTSVLLRQLEKEPWNDVLYFQLADEYALAQQYDSALFFNSFAVELDSTNYYYQLQKLNLISNEDAFKEEALRTAKRCVELNPGSAPDIYTMAEQYLRVHPDSVIHTLEQYADMLPENPRKYWLYQAAYLVMDSCDRAMRYGKLCEEKYPKDGNSMRKLLRAAQLCHNQQLISHYISRLSEIELIEPKEAILAFSSLTEIEDFDGILEITSSQFEKYSKIGKVEKGVMIAAISANYVPTHILLEEDVRQVYAKIFSEPVSNNLIREGILSYYKKIGDNRGIVRQIREIIDNPRTVMAFRGELIKQEYRHLLPDSSLRWDERTYAIRHTFTNYPFFIHEQLAYLVAISKFMGDKSMMDSIDSHIDKKKKLISSLTKKEKISIPFNDEKTIEVSHRDNRRRELSQLYSLKADLLAQQGDEEWQFYYRKSLKTDTKNDLAMNNFAYNIALYDSTQLRRALKLSKKSLEYSPESISYLDTYGYILYKLKRYEKSKEVFNRILSLKEKPPSEILMHYSLLLKAMGRKLAAEIYANKAKQAKREELEYGLRKRLEEKQEEY